MEESKVSNREEREKREKKEIKKDTFSKREFKQQIVD